MQGGQTFQSPLHTQLTSLIQSPNPSSGLPDTSIHLQLSADQLLIFKTQACPNHENPLYHSIHYSMEYPYYYSCCFYHSQRDHRRPPFVARADGGQDEVYQDVYVGDCFHEGFCANWLEYLYHPNVYKTKQCDNRACHRRYCPKIHPGEKLQQGNCKNKVEVQDKSLIEHVKLLQDIKKATSIANLQQNPIISNQIIETEKHIDTLTKKISQLDEQQATKQVSIKNELKTLAASKTSNKAQLLTYISEEYDKLFYNEQLNIIEDRYHEFKMFKDKDPRRVAAIVLEYISAFLNSDGGSIYLGVNDQSIVHGLEIDSKWLDRFQLAVDSDGRDYLNPPLIPQKYGLKIIPVVHNRKTDLKVIQIKVYPQQQSQKRILTLYKKQCYLRMNASNHRLSASDIMEYMRLINSNSHNSKKEAPVPVAQQGQMAYEDKIQQMGYKELKDYQEYLVKMGGKVAGLLKRRQKQQNIHGNSDTENIINNDNDIL